MGYKLAGYDVLGGVEIDPEMMKVYRANHNPKHSFLMGVQDFYKLPREKIPAELFNLDILDGSPPCSSFSTAGSREKAWGEKKKFREGQADQVLDDLFFHFIEVAKLLQPKVVVAENVKGLVIGKAKGYVKQIAAAFDLIGYDLQLFLLNAAFMGVPQKRERTFFVAKKKSLPSHKLSLSFKEELIPFRKIKNANGSKSLSARELKIWKARRPNEKDFSEVIERHGGKRTNFSMKFVLDERPLPTLTTKDVFIVSSDPRRISEQEIISGFSFPNDYNFLSLGARYICGMSVPPFMMQRVASEIERQWFG